MFPVPIPDEFPAAFERFLNAGDLAAVVALYDDQASIRMPGKGKASGHAAVYEEMRQLIGANASIANRLRDVIVHGDTALIIVDWTLDLSLPDGQIVRDTGTATNVLRSDGSGWKMIVANPYGTV